MTKDRKQPADAMRHNPLTADWNVALGGRAESVDIERLIDFSQLNEIFENVLDVIGLPVAVIDLGGHVLASSRWQRLCTAFHRANPETLARCIESDVALSGQMAEGKDYALYRCRNGLTDCATPVVIEGVHVANVFVGQFLLGPPDMAFFRALQQDSGFDEAAYFQALAEVPVVAEERLPAILRLMGGFAHQIANWSLAEHRARASAEQRTRELEESHEKLRKIAARVPGVVYQFLRRTDGSYCFPYASDAFESLVGLKAEDVREDAGPAFALVHPDDVARVFEAVAVSAATLAPWRCDFRVRRPDGTSRWLRGEAVPQQEADGAVLWHGFINDHTDRKRTEMLLEEAKETAERRAEELASSNADLEQFAYVASHDLRQPLRMVNSYLTLIERRYADRLDDDGREFIGYARGGAQQMDRLILDLLEYSRIGRQGQPPETVDLADAAADSCRGLQLAAEEAGASLAIAKAPARVVGNRSELIRLFQNLVGNALKYRSPDRPPRVDVGWRREGGDWRVLVQDNGIGIAPEFRKEVFKIFRRLHTANQYEGTGIGLAICQKIVKNHGGQIWIEPAPGGDGSVVVFTVPAAE